jgi:hypothetical protein
MHIACGPPNRLHEGRALVCRQRLKVGYTLPADPEASFTPADSVAERGLRASTRWNRFRYRNGLRLWDVNRNDSRIGV